MAVSPTVIKLLVTAATDKRTWKAIAIIIAAIFMPIILLIFLIVSLFSGVESANKNLLDYTFVGTEITSDFTDEQRKIIENMRSWLGELDEVIAEKENEDEDSSLDGNMVRAAFYCLNFGGNLDENFDYETFCECFENLEYTQLETALQAVSEHFAEYKITENLSLSIGKVYAYLEGNL